MNTAEPFTAEQWNTALPRINNWIGMDVEVEFCGWETIIEDLYRSYNMQWYYTVTCVDGLSLRWFSRLYISSNHQNQVTQYSYTGKVTEQYVRMK